MDELLLRLYLFLNIVVPLVFFMAAIYLALHIAFAQFVRNPASAVMWFLGVVTGPLTRPVRVWLAPGAPESKIRLLALGVYAALWLVSRAFFVWLGPVRQG
ncbi:MAG: hypothetical protein ABW216_00330 [Candidatus Rokuibacteriota bacterium]|jgi:hypothetical protein